MYKNRTIIGVFLVILIAGAVYAGLKMYAANIAEEKIDTAIAGMKDFVNVEYGNASVDLLSKNVHINDVTIRPAKSQTEPLSIDEIIIYDIDDSSAVPTFLDIGINGVALLINEFGKSEAEFLQSLGYGDLIKLDFGVSYRYQNTDKLFDLKKLSIREKDLGELSASFELGNLSLNKDGLLGLIFTYPQIILHNARLSFVNNDLLEKLLRYRAKELNKSVDRVRQETITEIEQQIAMTRNDAMQSVLRGVKAFVEKPGKLNVHIAPEKPVSIRQLLRLRDPNRLATALHLNVSNG